MVGQRLDSRSLVAMPKPATPPPAQPHYEGFHWLGSQWGRTGKPTPSIVTGGLTLAAAAIMYSIGIDAVAQSGSTATVLMSAVVGSACVLAAAFYFIEAHFAGRAEREQEPTTPAALPEPPAST